MNILSYAYPQQNLRCFHRVTSRVTDTVKCREKRFYDLAFVPFFSPKKVALTRGPSVDVPVDSFNVPDLSMDVLRESTIASLLMLL